MLLQKTLISSHHVQREYVIVYGAEIVKTKHKFILGRPETPNVSPSWTSNKVLLCEYFYGLSYITNLHYDMVFDIVAACCFSHHVVYFTSFAKHAAQRIEKYDMSLCYSPYY